MSVATVLAELENIERAIAETDREVDRQVVRYEVGCACCMSRREQRESLRLDVLLRKQSRRRERRRFLLAYLDEHVGEGS